MARYLKEFSIQGVQRGSELYCNKVQKLINMKKTYLSPCIEVFKAEPLLMLATSMVNITVDNETFDGEGRVKEFSEWADIWDSEE